MLLNIHSFANITADKNVWSMLLNYSFISVCVAGETLFSCPHTFKFRTRLLTGTTSGMASDCPLQHSLDMVQLYIQLLMLTNLLYLCSSALEVSTVCFTPRSVFY